MWHCDLCCEQNRPGHVLSPISKWHSRAFIRGTLLSHSHLQARKGGQPKEQHLREGSEETGRAVPKDAGIWALSWGRYSQDKVVSFTLSPAFADLRRLCKIQHLLSLEAEVHRLGFTPILWEVVWGLLCCWQLEISICSFFLFPFQMCIIQTQRRCTSVPKRWEERTFLTTMKLLVCLVNTKAAEADLGRHFPYPYPANTYLGADGYLKS